MQFKIDPEFKGLVPPLSPEEYLLLEESILKEGCREPLIIWQGTLLDGHHRLKICKEHGIVFKTANVSEKIKDRIDARIWIRNNQRGRRNLTPAWKIELELGNKEDLLKKGKQTKIEAGKQARAVQLGVLSPGGKTPIDKHNTRKEIAKAAGVSTGQVAMAEQVRKKAPKLWKQAKKGDISIKKAYSKIKKQETRQEKAASLQPQPLPEGTYNVILADPPWRYEFSETTERAIENQYPTMDLGAIKTLQVPSAKDAILFLWTTAPKLEEALMVMRSWGFKYRTCAVWDKEVMGMGYWFRIQHELLLVGVKGNFSPPPEGKRLRSVIREKRTGHSKKPIVIYEMIENMFPSGKYLELFARNQRQGWKKWGNEI